MTFLLLNQTFYPDLSATGQYLTDLAVGLSARGHQVTVIAARRAYTDPKRKFPKQEFWKGIRIWRVASTGFGKRTKCGRMVDALSFLFFCSLRVLISARPDIVVALTSPPLISFLAAVFSRFRRCKFCYWVMDFNPDEAVAAGWLRQTSFTAQVLLQISGFILKHATKIIALDRFMRNRIIARGGRPERTLVLPLWSQDTQVRFDPAGRERFRAKHGLERKFVVMYSGNHSACHPLDSLVSAAESLATEPDICFCFVGGGSEWQRCRRSTPNMLFLPYQSMTGLSASLSAADLHVVLMGERFVGLVHPCKLYNLLTIGAPLLYIGPPQSHITELLGSSAHRNWLLTARDGEVQTIAQHIRNVHALGASQVRHLPPRDCFAQSQVVARLIEVLEV